jgi:hypothetical protein
MPGSGADVNGGDLGVPFRDNCCIPAQHSLNPPLTLIDHYRLS